MGGHFHGYRADVGIQGPNLLRGNPSKWNQNKCCWFHKYISHTTEECITLKNEIEKLIHRGYLQYYVNDRRTKPQNDRPEAKPPYEIQTTFGEPHFALEMRGAQDHYVREMKDKPLTNILSVDKRPTK